MRIRPLKLFLIFFTAGWSALGFAQPTGELLAAAQVQGETLQLSLDEASHLALANNFDIQLAKYDTSIARTQEGVAKSIYDTVIDAEISYRNNQSKQTNTILGSKIIDNDYNVGLSKQLPTGTNIGLDMDNNRNWSNSPFVTINPSHNSAMDLSIRQDFGKNFFGIQDRGSVKITMLDIERTEYLSLARIEQDLADVQKAYWDLALQAERVLIEEEMVALAKELLDINQEKYENGLVEQPDFLASQANYQQRVNGLLLVQNQLQTQENVLRLLLNIPRDDVRIVAGDDLQITKVSCLLDVSLKTAFENRYDYKEAIKAVESRGIGIEMKKNNIWPEINLTTSLARNGVDDHFSQAIQQIFEEDNPDFFAGITFNVPLENTKARSELKAAQLQKAQALVSLKLLERRIMLGVVDQVRRCKVLEEIAVNAENIAAIQTEKLTAEEKRFKNGRSDTDTIIRFQEDVTQARFIAAQAKHNYQVALVDLQLTEASLLNKYWEVEI